MAARPARSAPRPSRDALDALGVQLGVQLPPAAAASGTVTGRVTARVTAGTGPPVSTPRRRHVHRHELQQQELHAAAAGQGRVPAGSLRGVQRLQGALHGVSAPQRLRERGLPAERQGLPGVPHGQATYG